MALEGVFGNMGKRKRKGFLGLFCGIGERSPHTHDTNMEGRKGKNMKGKKERTMERKEKERCQDFLVFSTAGVRDVKYLKSRDHDLLKELDGNLES